MKNGMVHQYYRHVLAFIFAVDEINRNPDILPNVTLGYHIFDSCRDVNNAMYNVFNILSGPGRTVPNYSCMEKHKVVGFIGDLSTDTSLHMAQLLRHYSYTQISYGSTDPLLSNKHLYPSFFQTLPSDLTQYHAIAKLLRHFGWIWVGIVTSDDETGGQQSLDMSRVLGKYGICIEYTLKTPQEQDVKRDLFFYKIEENLKNKTSRVAVLCGRVSMFYMNSLRKGEGSLLEKILIVPVNWNYHVYSTARSLRALFNGTLFFKSPSKNIPSLQRVLENIYKTNAKDDKLLEDLFATYFRCLTSVPLRNMFLQDVHNYSLKNCSGKEKLIDLKKQGYDTVNFRTTYHVYKAVYAMAYALHEMLVSFSHGTGNENRGIHIQKEKLHHFLAKVHFKDPTGEEVHFNKNGEMTTAYHILNQINFHNGTSVQRHVGSFNMSAPEEEQLTIDHSGFTWHLDGSGIPVSRCTPMCHPGQRKVPQEGQQHTCCYGCVQCSEGMISTQTDREACLACPDDKWPNKNKDKCLLRSSEFLSYQSDAKAVLFSIISILFTVITSIILTIFISLRHTPIVKANNQNLSFLLLVSIMMSFLCVFLFLGQPVDVTCMLRQTCFGIIFSVVVSSVLAKTIMVCIVFKASKPGNYWKKCIGVKIPNSIVIICSIIQVSISITWLCISPPFMELNYSFPGKIIIQCNEGSAVAFYTMLGYLGFLAAVSFIVAFMARKLPDSFNEAKYITFSMLVFCSVWVSFIPAYLSVSGKNTVVVEIFAIIASSFGVLGSIFFPKCYIILIKPERNSKKNLLGHSHNKH
ncbi:hypothetical protein XELAEV_18004934mg [Xenopus laevis]|uniref:G-protein coupled receptors family 3 profile domain-containing protein n=1 Tax=Xenopus laevis TaxID=8355 RepID=A0A974DWA2_XENLA|nr:hypothetical protein XELAEV_18004934mg [Xenopus laevis]